MIDKNYWLKEWKRIMCGLMYELEPEFFDFNIHCNTPDGIVTCSECRYYIEEDD